MEATSKLLPDVSSPWSVSFTIVCYLMISVGFPVDNFKQNNCFPWIYLAIFQKYRINLFLQHCILSWSGNGTDDFIRYFFISPLNEVEAICILELWAMCISGRKNQDLIKNHCSPIKWSLAEPSDPCHSSSFAVRWIHWSPNLGSRRVCA